MNHISTGTVIPYGSLQNTFLSSSFPVAKAVGRWKEAQHNTTTYLGWTGRTLDDQGRLHRTYAHGMDCADSIALNDARGVWREGDGLFHDDKKNHTTPHHVFHKQMDSNRQPIQQMVLVLVLVLVLVHPPHDAKIERYRNRRVVDRADSSNTDSVF